MPQVPDADLVEELAIARRERDEARQQQAATSELLKVIGRSTLDLQPVFETLAENAVRLCEAKRSFIYRFDGQYLRVVATHNASPEMRASSSRIQLRLEEAAPRRAPLWNGAPFKCSMPRVTPSTPTGRGRLIPSEP